MSQSPDARIDVHHYDQQIEIQKQLLEKANIRDDNRQTIKDFANFCKIDNKVGLSRLRLYYYALRNIAELTDTHFKDMTEMDIIGVLSRLQDHKYERHGKTYNYSEQILQDYRKAISKFWRWLYFDEYRGEAPPQIRRIKVSSKNGKSEPEIYSREEIKKIIDSMPTIRDKAFFACLYDLQPRSSELLTRQLKHVRYNEHGNLEIFIESTKNKNSHWETLFESVPYFVTWLRLHPTPDDPNAPLWIAKKYKRKDAAGSATEITPLNDERIQPMSYPLARKIFITVCKKQGIRPIKMHMLRKSKATHDLADGVPVSYIESRGSWSKGSKALQDCYLAIMKNDKDNAYQKKYNIVNNNHTPTNDIQACERCHVYLERGAKFCHTCGFPVDKTLIAKAEELNKAAAELVDKDMLSDMIKKIVLAELKELKAATR